MSSVEPILVSALLLGFFGSVHCLGMCGGIAAALGQALPDQSAGSRLRNASVYSFGRITSYVAAGAIVGFFGEVFTSWTGLTVLLRVLAGLLILAFGLHVAGWRNGLAAIERIWLMAWRRLAPLGAGFMVCFGLGTLLAFLALRSGRRAAGILLLVFGFWSIAGRLGLFIKMARTRCKT